MVDVFYIYPFLYLYNSLLWSEKKSIKTVTRIEALRAGFAGFARDLGFLVSFATLTFIGFRYLVYTRNKALLRSVFQTDAPARCAPVEITSRSSCKQDKQPVIGLLGRSRLNRLSGTKELL